MEWYVIMLNLSRWLEVLWLVDSCYLIFVIEIYFGLTDLPQLIYGRFNFIQHWHIQYSTLSYSPMKKSFCSIGQIKCHYTHWSCAFSSNCNLEKGSKVFFWKYALTIIVWADNPGLILIWFCESVNYIERFFTN